MFKVVESETKGRCAIATTTRHVDELIFEALPYALVPTEPNKQHTCAVCFCFAPDDVLPLACMYCNLVWFCSAPCENRAYESRYTLGASNTGEWQPHSWLECAALPWLPRSIERLVEQEAPSSIASDCSTQKLLDDAISEVRLLLAILARAMFEIDHDHENEYDRPEVLPRTDVMVSMPPARLTYNQHVRSLVTNRDRAPESHCIRASELSRVSLELLENAISANCSGGSPEFYLPSLDDVIDLYFAVASNGFGLWSDLLLLGGEHNDTGSDSGTPQHGECFAHGLYPTASFFNHDCSPNVRRSIAARGRLVFAAARDIAPEDELTISYVDPAWPRSQRVCHLLENYYFTCCCSKCNGHQE